MFEQSHGKFKITSIKNNFANYHVGKVSGKAVTAITRELVGFIWAVTQEIENKSIVK